MSGPTPGPWHLLETVEVRGPKDESVVWELGPNKPDHALITAAPDLLAALKMLLADVEDYQTRNNLGGENNHSQVTARAAIAKAEGR